MSLTVIRWRAGSIKGFLFRTALIAVVSLCGFSRQCIASQSSPGTVVFSNPTALNTSAIFGSTGTFILQLTASDGVKSTTATVTIVVNQAVIMPQLLVGSGAAIAGNALAIPIILSTGTTGVAGVQFDFDFPAGLSTSTIIAGASAIAAGKTVSTNVVGGDLRVIIAGLNQNVMNSGQVAVITMQSAAGLSAGPLTVDLLNVSAVDANGVSIPMAPSGIGTIQVTANKAPTVNIGGNQTITLPASANLTATVTDDGAPNPPGALTYSWTVL